MGNLEHVRRQRAQLPLGDDFDVARKEQGGPCHFGQDHQRLIVGRGVAAQRAEHTECDAPYPHDPAGRWYLHGDASRRSGRAERSKAVLRLGQWGMPETIHRESLHDAQEAREVVLVRVGEDDQVQTRHPVAMQLLHQQGGVGSAVDQYRRPVGAEEQGGVPLPHVEEHRGRPFHHRERKPDHQEQHPRGTHRQQGTQGPHCQQRGEGQHGAHSGDSQLRPRRRHPGDRQHPPRGEQTHAGEGRNAG